MLICRNLTCIREDNLVFKNLNFTVHKGGALLVHGPNGSGKSTLLQVICGLIAPAKGFVSWDGINSSLLRTKVHWIQHLDGFKKSLTVLENLSFWVSLYQKTDNIDFLQILKKINLESLANTPVDYLSQGQRRRLSLAKVLAIPAPIWLLDEPTIALDTKSVRILENLINHHRSMGGIVIVSSHVNLILKQACSISLE